MFNNILENYSSQNLNFCYSAFLYTFWHTLKCIAINEYCIKKYIMLILKYWKTSIVLKYIIYVIFLMFSLLTWKWHLKKRSSINFVECYLISKTESIHWTLTSFSILLVLLTGVLMFCLIEFTWLWPYFQLTEIFKG